MKKIMMMAAVCLMFLATACSSSDPKALADKVKSQQELTQSDYSEMLEYLDKAMADMPTGEGMTDEADMDAYMKKIEKWQSDYGYMMTFNEALMQALAEDALDADNQAKLDKINEKLTKDL